MHLADSRAPYRTSKRYASEVLDLMEKQWDMSPASVLISITGGAQDFVLPPRLNKAFRHGLARAAQATNAWVFTGGTDSGVMQLVGQAIAEYNVSCACIGVVTWGVVLGRDHLRGLRGETAELAQRQIALDWLAQTRKGTDSNPICDFRGGTPMKPDSWVVKGGR